MSYRIAKSLAALRTEINRKAPNRNKNSDGWIGDPSHAANGSGSDHNPWIEDSAGVGVVRALDITHDPRNGCDGAVLAESIRQLGIKGDSRLKNGGYVIFNRRIASASRGWAWRKYSGKNPHDKHVHVSVSKTQSGYDAARAWNVTTKKSPPTAKPTTHTVAKGDTLIRIAKRYKLTTGNLSAWNRLANPNALRIGQILRLTGPAATPPAGLGKRNLKVGATGADVRELQTRLNGHGARVKVDGEYGPDTRDAVRAFQKKNRLTVDGIAGPKTVAALRR